MKAPLTRDGNAPAVPLWAEEAAELRRESDEFDQMVADALSDDADYLRGRYLELLTTGTTTIEASGSTWSATLQRSWWRDGWLVSEWGRPGGTSGSGRTRVSRKCTDSQLEAAVTLQLAVGLALLRDTD
jgi:hypothetical protein